MAKHRQPSRFNIRYLAARHAGMVFFLFALGLCAGTAWRSLCQPTRYYAEAETPAGVVPASAAFDWQSKRREWRDLLETERDRRLLSVNLRHVLKLAATRDMRLDTADLASELARFLPTRRFSAVLLPGWVPDDLESAVEPTLRDLAANLDFQSLALVLCDLDPPADTPEWDLTLGQARDNSLRSLMITRPGPEDRFFRVFHRLHALLHPERASVAPEEAWRTAVDYLAERLDRETRFAGGGGFGPIAARELLREIAAVPALAANSLYNADGWFYGDSDFRGESAVWERRWREDAVLELAQSDAASGVAKASMKIELYPLTFPRNTVLTRIAPLATATLLAYAAAREENIMRASAVAAEPAPAKTVIAAVVPAIDPILPEEVPAPDPVEFENVPETGSGQDILALEASLPGLRGDLAAALRRLETARNAEARLAAEAIAAHTRADRLKERYDEAADQPTEEEERLVSVEETRLLLSRDALRERLAELLQTCTEEHPFVKQARRELVAVETLLAELDCEPAPEPAVDTRLRNLFLEWEAALSRARAIDERLRRQGEAAGQALTAAADLEKRIASVTAELLRLRASKAAPAPVVRRQAPQPVPQTRQEPVRVEAVAPQPPALPAQQPHGLAVAPPPGRIAQDRYPPSREAIWLGGILGLLAGLFWILLRELFSFRFADAAEAQRFVPYPLLAALPAYDAKSFLAAAGTMKGEVMGKKAGALFFAPMPVELAEPQPAARRGSIQPARRRLRPLPWIAGAVLLALAFALGHAARRGLARPPVAFEGDLPVPQPATLHRETPGENEKWGNLP